jgi:murein endopeptidase
MFKLSVLLVFCQVLLAAGHSASAEDYSDCRIRCETDYSDCTNQPPAPESEVQNAKMAACDTRLASCYADCENVKPPENPPGTENNPNIIWK